MEERELHRIVLFVNSPLVYVSSSALPWGVSLQVRPRPWVSVVVSDEHPLKFRLICRGKETVSQ